MRWGRRFGDLLARPAGELLAHVLQHFPLFRHVFECLGDLSPESQHRLRFGAT
jgi:hypothetical protein